MRNWTFIILLAVALPSLSASSSLEAETIKGLSGFGVAIENFDEADKQAGFDKRTFQAAVELKLRLAGIKVLSQEEMLSTPGMPDLYVNVNTLASGDRRSAPWALQIEVKQQVLLPHVARMWTTATTWSQGCVGYGDVQHVRNALDGLMDMFINDWLSVNSKE
jgi:hypothetical protein